MRRGVVKATGEIEHAQDVRDARGVPSAKGLAEAASEIKHASGARGARGIPRAEGLVEAPGVAEHVHYVCARRSKCPKRRGGWSKHLA